MLMGVGNLTELTDADTTGITMTADGHGLRAGDPQRAGRAGEPALPAARCARPSWRGASSMPPRPTAACRRATTPACCACATAGRFPNSPAEIAASAAEVDRPEFPDRGRRGRHPRLQPRRPSCRRRSVRPVPAARGRAGRRPRLLSGRRAGAGRRSPSSSASAMSRTASCAGAAPCRPPAEDRLHLEPAGQHAAAPRSRRKER